MPLFFEKVILIDDDPILNYLNRTIIQKFFRPHGIDILSFDKPEEGLVYITESSGKETGNTVLFLDINMPDLSGWDVLDKMCVIERENLRYLSTYILSSSIDPADIHKAKFHPLVAGFISKPLSKELVTVFGRTIAEKTGGKTQTAVI